MPDADPIYLFDTSSLNRIRRQPDSNLAWDVIVGLIEGGRGYTVAEVFDELEKVNPAAHDRLRTYRRQMVIRRNNARYTAAAGIRSKYRSMAKASKPHDSADAWVVGVAKTEQYVVVTNENPNGHGQKMPKVCNKEYVAWISLEDLLEHESS